MNKQSILIALEIISNRYNAYAERAEDTANKYKSRDAGIAVGLAIASSLFTMAINGVDEKSMRFMDTMHSKNF